LFFEWKDSGDVMVVRIGSCWWRVGGGRGGVLGVGGGGGRGALPYLGYTGTCHWIGYGFLASLS